MNQNIGEILRDIVRRQVKDNRVAVLLSGGVDSLSVAFAAQDVGLDVHAYSFQLDTHPSYDYQKSQEVSNHFNWEFTGITVPTNQLKKDFHRLVDYDCKKKTHFECVYPFLYVYPEIKEKYVLSGWAADGYYGISKKAMMHYRETQELFDTFRDNYFSPNMQAGYKWHKKVADRHDKIFVTPYLEEEVKNFFYPQSWEELNKPYQKHHVRDAFPQFTQIGKVKNHLNLQIDSKITDLFESLIDDKEINFRGRKRVMDICRDWHGLNNMGNLENFL